MSIASQRILDKLFPPSRPRRISIDTRPDNDDWGRGGTKCNLIGNHTRALFARILCTAVGVTGGTRHLLKPIDVLLLRLNTVRLEAAADAARQSNDDGGTDGGE